MKYKGSIIIDQPRATVVELFANPDYNKDYQDGFLRKELVSGQPGQDGAVSNMYYKFGKRDMKLVETITKNRLPESFEAFYHHPHMDNTMKCTFASMGDNKTCYEYEFVYTRVSGIIPRLLVMLFPGMFRKQGEKWVRQFKEFAEK